VDIAYQPARWPAGAPAGSAVAGRPAHQFIVACLAASRVTGIEKTHGPLPMPPEQMGRRGRAPLPPGGRGCLVPAALIVKPISTGPTHGDQTAPPIGAKNDLDIPDLLRRAAPERLRAPALGVADDDPRGFE
jgi:hypothetical protein